MPVISVMGFIFDSSNFECYSVIFHDNQRSLPFSSIKKYKCNLWPHYVECRFTKWLIVLHDSLWQSFCVLKVISTFSLLHYYTMLPHMWQLN
jgi:hypothetical protein